MNRSQPGIILIVFILLFFAASCNRANEFEEQEAQEISEYLEEHSTYNFELKPSGLYYCELLKGTGTVPVNNDTAYVRYTGRFLDGRIFDSNVDSSTPLEVVIGSPYIIQGFSEGLRYMATGGKALLLIPSSLGYGTMGNYYGGIGGYTPLLFDIELVLVKPAK